MCQFLRDRNSKTEVPTRILQLYAPNCEVKDVTLYYNIKREDRPPSTVPVLPQSLQLQCLLDNHSSTLAGHAKTYKTMHRILDSCWWPNLARDIDKLISTCETCQRSAPQAQHPPGPIGKHEIPTAFNQSLSVDLFGPVVLNNRDKHYIQVITCRYSNFTVFGLCANKTPQEVAKVLVDKWITNFGLPSIIISDLGSEYVADLHTT